MCHVKKRLGKNLSIFWVFDSLYIQVEIDISSRIPKLLIILWTISISNPQSTIQFLSRSHLWNGRFFFLILFVGLCLVIHNSFVVFFSHYIVNKSNSNKLTKWSEQHMDFAHCIVCMMKKIYLLFLLLLQHYKLSIKMKSNRKHVMRTSQREEDRRQTIHNTTHPKARHNDEERKKVYIYKIYCKNVEMNKSADVMMNVHLFNRHENCFISYRFYIQYLTAIHMTHKHEIACKKWYTQMVS